MVMSDYIYLLSKFNGKVFSAKDSRNIGIPRSYLRKWLERNLVERVAHGIYKEVNDDYDKSMPLVDALSCLKSPSAVCLLSALEFYNLTDQIPKKIWVMLPANRKSSQPGIKIFRTRNPMWDKGISNLNGLYITNVERTLIDCLLNKKMLGLSVVMSSLKVALHLKKTDLSKIIRLSKDMGVYHRIEATIEVLL